MGSSMAIVILSNEWIPIWGAVLITVVHIYLLLFLPYFGMRKLEIFIALLIFIMLVSCLINSTSYGPNVDEAFIGLIVPKIKSEVSLQYTMAVLGASVMSHNIFLHSSLVLTRIINVNNINSINQAIIYNSFETLIGLFFSFVVNTSIIIFFAIYRDRGGSKEIMHNVFHINKYLDPIFHSESAKYCFAVGLLMAGLGGTMAGTYAGQFIAEGFLNL